MLVSRPTQDEAHDEIDDWLESGLQSYTEEGQRMRDAANGVHLSKRSTAATATADVVGRLEEPEQASPPPAYPEETAPAPLNEDNANVPSRSHGSMRCGGIVRHITISGDYNNMHLNTGTGQQNIAHYDYRKYRDEENVQDYQVAVNGGGEEGYDGANVDRNDHENSQDDTPGYRSPIGGRDDRDNWRDDRYDEEYDGRNNRQYDDYDERYNERRGRRNPPARDSRTGARYDDDDGYGSHGSYYSYGDESPYSDW
ncbi:hypothetical protein J4E93_009766 [Alternaria ventricosa]|uniref:uncharacterized protein n=1 Tax=Alternaria ventricosa TaxID=1187951 RepID=UPI0020C2E30F|nr:uncharacterized protein J4E93_009766 [Alternaria ventricosa]KAI4638738.1 hypothetical protein J4E93_009766 [Alternaria ventricosa]